MQDKPPSADRTGTAHSLTDLGWSAHFAEQQDAAAGLLPMRIISVQRAMATGLDAQGEHVLGFPPELRAGGLAVGDWVLVDPDTGRIAKVLDRLSLLSRRAAGIEAKPQLLAANVDTLFITTSCNADFNPARLERYLVLALDAGIAPVIVLTKTDQAEAPEDFVAQARALSDKLAGVIALNAKDPAQVARLSEWCGPGRTVAFVGSSGVGKSTLINALTGSLQATAEMRQDDAKGRHTTTARSLHLMAGGGLVIDMPGMRELGLHDVAGGIAELFEDITLLTTECKFRDCKHMAEPGCAVQAAVAAGQLDPARLDRWRKLKSEDRLNTTSMTVSRRQARALTRAHKAEQDANRNAKSAKPGKGPRKG
ncbi:MAG: ribosome small subunit-dependent GTPase A [Rhodobacterales bacterium]|nr:ribosome small subunit-dependent GTPase A [Rhodobacterales bacterium]MDX5413591.1 ribosome small subunit-dependent GTPase A [Rhodobacterales bacterium]